MELHTTSLPALLPLLLFVVLLLSRVSAQTADIEVRMDEERAVGSVVVNVSQYPALFLEVSEDERPKLTFNILDKASRDASFFAIDSATGVITVAQRLDREAVCGGQDSCHVRFNLAIQGSRGLSFSTIASVKVYVDDVNDNAPAFPTDQVELEISEVAKVGYVLKLSGPQDPDSPPNNTIQRYELTLPQPVFSVSPTENPDGSTVLNLRLETELDRETRAEYDFNIIVYDGGTPPKSDFLRVVVRVTDDNDNAPVFERLAYTANVREDASPGTEVIQVRATDQDAGDFGAVRYRFSSLASQDVGRLFAINASSGSISLRTQVEPAAGDAPYSLVVEAFDGGEPPSVAQAVVTVLVLNTGNNAPVVRIVTVSEGDTSQVLLPESSELNAFVAFVNVEDRDQGSNGEVSCSMLDSDHFSLQPLPNKGYQVLLARPVDREVLSSYDAAIVCRDSGSPSLSTQADFTVVITDVNDNDPSFAQDHFSGTVAENNADGQYLLQVSATDRDDGDNARLTYAILEPEAADYVSVHAQSGVVRARVSLDREATPSLTFTLAAVDHGPSPRTGTAGLTITVADVNDNSPQLLNVPYLFEVSEGASPGHVIANMAALDMDEGDNGEVEFFFAGSVSGEVPFTVHTNGTVAVFGVLDRETSESHVFTVLARDKGAIPRSNSTQVTIRVTDINDNAPVILFPTSVNHSVVITTLPEQGVTLGRVIAYDVDEGNASSLRFTIQGGDAQGVFDIHPDKGEIFLADLRRLRNPFTYQVVLRVYDRGPIPLFAQTSLQIDVHFPNISLPGGGFGSGSGGSHGDGGDEEEPRDSYVVIVGVIGGATLVLSGIIIGAILFVLRSERRKPRGGDGAPGGYKNDYVPAPTGIGGSGGGVGVPSDAKFLEPHYLPNFPEAPMRSSASSSHSDVSASGLVLSPHSLPHKAAAGSSEGVQKKVSFSFDEPDVEGRGGQLHSQEMLLVPLSASSLSSSSSSSHGGGSHHHQHQHQQHHQEAPSPASEAANVAWKRVASPDDLNSDTSGDSGTCDSGRGASDDDIHLDNSVDRHGVKHGAPAPPLTNTNRTPAPGPRSHAQGNFYTSSTFALATFRPHQHPHPHQDDNHHDHNDGGEGEGEGLEGDAPPESYYAQGPFVSEEPPRAGTGHPAGRQQPAPFVHGSSGEGRNHHHHPPPPPPPYDPPPHPSYQRGGKVAPAGGHKLPGPRRPVDSPSPAHPFQLHHHHPPPPPPPQMGPVVSLHPEAKSGSPNTFWQGHGQAGTGSRRSLDLVENRRGGGGGRMRGGGGGPWPLPPRCSSSLSYQQGSSTAAGSSGGAVSGEDDAASTTTSGSYTLSPDELRGLESGGVGGGGGSGHIHGGVSHDIIV